MKPFRRAIAQNRNWRDDLAPAEIYSAERLEQFAEKLALTQDIFPRRTAGVALHKGLRAASETLRNAFRELNAGLRKGEAITPAAAWLVDNFYLVDEHVKAVRRDLPAGFYRELPKLSSGPLRNYPRVFGLMNGLMDHSDYRFDLDTLARYCRAYQRIQPLTIGELWAIAITLRVVLIEALARLAAGIVERRELRQQANAFADELLTHGQSAQIPAGENEPVASAYGAQLFQRLRDHDPQTTPALAWLQRRLALQDTTPEDLVHLEHQRQGAVNLSVRNIITSLRWVSAVDWAKFFESISLVDARLRDATNFAAFDFSTRDRYRHAIEDLARRSGLSELDVTQRALEMSQRVHPAQDAPPSAETATADPGYYLLAAGSLAFENTLGCRPAWRLRIERVTRRAGVLGYGGTILTITVALTLLIALLFRHALSTMAFAGIIAAGFFAASEIGVAIVNQCINFICPPRILPGLELKEGVPPHLRTLIVIPILLTTTDEIAQAVENLEIHYLSSDAGEIAFALLSDWTDATSEHVPTDDALLAAAANGIDRLNATYAPFPQERRFLLFHRRRLWNPSQQRWMGWERKRGKLEEFNRLLRGSTETSFLDEDRLPLHVPQNVRYVISLDSDTRLPRGAALGLIGKMAHPLNRPEFDRDGRRVVTGYAILQPRVTPSLPDGRDASFFQRVYSGPSGIDPYAFAVSDVYQDLFGEGSFSGKGIFEVDAFAKSLAGRVPDNTLLSHDLFEGTYARAGYASDVEVVEEYPTRYDVASQRQHRWVRGDWQLLPWILGVRGALPALGRWKMWDNLRRALVPPAVLLGLALAWASSLFAVGTLVFLGAVALPVLLPFVIGLASGLDRSFHRGYARRLREDAAQAFSLIGLRVIFLADQAWLMLDAIVRTLYRLGISHKRLLEWTTTAQSTRGAPTSGAAYLRTMRGGLILALIIAACEWSNGRLNWLAGALLLAWLLAPLIARAISVPPRRLAHEILAASDARRLRLQARQTWSFFDSFVRAEHHMLPPDNFQEIPNPVIANRTSPTNIGLYLLTVVAARDFGWIGTEDALDRLEATLATLGRMETFRGHFYNWYDTHDLRPLDPKYISTVDSGNLAGHLLTLTEAVRDWDTLQTPERILRQGIEDTLDQLQIAMSEFESEDQRTYGVSPRHVQAMMDTFRKLLATPDSWTPEALPPALIDAADRIRDLAQALSDERKEAPQTTLLQWAGMLQATVRSLKRDRIGPEAIASRLERVQRVATQAHDLCMAMEFGFLVHSERQLLSIGYRVAEREQDPSCYDLLASEARLASFVAIAKGDLPVRHWFRLGRRLTSTGRGAALISWSGSMFEYLMPILVMREPAGSVLGETARVIVQRQIQYGRERGLPWGVSESALNARDRELTYQYSSFGVPGLGLQRGLETQAVVAPYATGLAAMVDAPASLRNFDALQAIGARGRFGWYDAIDFTPARLPEGATGVPVQAYMAHHQGMILLSIANVLNDGIFRTYFHSNPLIKATELLLQEKTPQDLALSRSALSEDDSTPRTNDLPPAPPRRYTSPHHAIPRTHVLSNGHYSVMLTAAGSGYSRWRDMAVTRWREDATCDAWGSYIFLRDVGDGTVWSAGYQPVGREPDEYAVEFYEDRAEIVRRDGSILTSMEVLVSPEEDGEVRQVSLTNRGGRAREIELTTYAEVVLTSTEADGAHPAFSKLFVHTEFLADAGALVITRRGREPADPQPWLTVVSAVEGDGLNSVQFETDRARFLGRGRELRDALSIIDARPLSGTVGFVLDPIASLRRRVRVAPGKTVRVTFWTNISGSRTEAMALLDKHRDRAAFERVKTLAWTQAQVQLRYLGIGFEAAQRFQQIANRVLYADASLRAPRELIERSRLGQSALWALGISGDLPLVVVRIDSEHELSLVQELLRAHEYWRLKRIAVDLVILNEHPTSYAADLQHALDHAIRGAQGAPDEGRGRRGAVFLLRADLISIDIKDLLQSAARVILVAGRGTLADQLARVREPTAQPRRTLIRPQGAVARSEEAIDVPPLELFNGMGGFARSGREYVVILDQNQWTPAPWSNVIANEQFGFLVSADGAGATWSINSQQNRLTNWSNDPIANTPAEAIYLRDDTTGALWSATPLPIREPDQTYLVRHGMGYTRFEHRSHGIALDLLQFVPEKDAVKISRLKIKNHSDRRRRLSATYYLDWVLGNQRSKTALYVVTELETKTSALFARNPWNGDYATRVAFMDMAGSQQSATGDRSEFIGRHGSLAEPVALLTSASLSNRVGAGFDPCGALQSKIDLQPGEETELILLLGDADSRAAAVALIERYRAVDVEAVFQAVIAHWDRTLDTVQVKTPDRAMDILLNGWLLYQTLACRVWGRTAFYQSSGAYGFRDQLQDVMALCVSNPSIAREHILRAAGRQFQAGDVQHWWLPTSGQGVRTRVSDDRIWLPFVICHYLEVTADRAILAEPVPYLAGEALAADAHEVFSAPGPAVGESLFEHCVRALDSSLTIGSHGLPLFGTGDWNDGMNRVGAAGRGESVWLAWFLHTTLMRFSGVADTHGAEAPAARWRKHAFALQRAIEREAWDGDWYRRGYFDDGTPLGSVSSDECRIDSIAQSWAVISGAGDPERARRAMASVNAQLVNRSDGLVQLFTPAFDRTPKDPGYIKAYPPGIRENGGQYTHAAMWSVLAFALSGDGDRASELFSLINPINHTSSRTGIQRYKVEPYVACADVYAASSHVGRGGWTWYTGSAAWMYRAALEAILGFEVRGDRLVITPCIPKAWNGFEITYRRGTTSYRLVIQNPRGVSRGVRRASLDETALEIEPCTIPLLDDGAGHLVTIVLGEA